jgi:hypothetical protein
MAGRPIWIARFGLLRDRESAEVTSTYSWSLDSIMRCLLSGDENYHGSLHRVRPIPHVL